jgi:hypothetical protein
MTVILILLAIVLPFGLGAMLGAPYLPVLKRDARKLLELADLKPGQTLIDLGSGDGRLLRAAAAQGITCIGYEINPYLVLVSRIVCWRYRKLVTIHTADLWRTKLPPADAVYIFLLDRYMARLDAKLKVEIHKPTKIISYVFELPQTPIKSSRNTYVYEYPVAATSLK